MRLTRMTTRRWITVVAILGLVLGLFIGGWRFKKQRDYCLEKASHHAEMEKIFLAIEKAPPIEEKTEFGFRSAPPCILIDGRSYPPATLVKYHAELKQRYRRCAFRPWLSVLREPSQYDLNWDFVITSPFIYPIDHEKAQSFPPRSNASPRS
jgi:hypothetical protein